LGIAQPIAALPVQAEAGNREALNPGTLDIGTDWQSNTAEIPRKQVQRMTNFAKKRICEAYRAYGLGCKSLK
jgi:hypothetical protein